MANQISFQMKDISANPILITSQVKKKQRWLSLFQKYELIRLNDLIFHKQLSDAFKQIKSKKTIPQTSTFENLPQEQKYSVSIDVIRPKLKGESIIHKSFDVSNLTIKRSIRIKKNYMESLYKENVNLINAQFKTKEMDMEIQNIKQLLMLQNVQRQKLIIPHLIIKSQRRINKLYVLSVLFVIILLCIEC